MSSWVGKLQRQTLIVKKVDFFRTTMFQKLRALSKDGLVCKFHSVNGNHQNRKARVLFHLQARRQAPSSSFLFQACFLLPPLFVCSHSHLASAASLRALVIPHS